METEAAVEVVNAFAAFGPEWLFAFVICGLLIFLVVKLIPMLQDVAQRKIDLQKADAEARHEIEMMREQRKADEEQSREQRDRERSEAEGRWAAQNERAIIAQEKSNVVMDAVKAQLEVMNAQLMDSKANSKVLREQIANMSIKVDQIHDELMK